MNQLTVIALVIAAAAAGTSAFKCEGEGMFGDPDDSKAFHVCTRGPQGIIQGKLSCGPNTEFDPLSKNCVHPNAKFMPGLRSLMLSDDVPRGISCKKPGYKCLSCNALVLCVGVSGGFQTIPVLNGTCTEGLVCDDGAGCVASQYCTHGTFECSDEGYFPDPYDCQLYHVCMLKGGLMTHEVRSCEIYNNAYIPLTGQCGGSIWSTYCTDRPIPRCKQHFEVGVLPTNPNIYYVCIANEVTKTIAPKLLKCPGGKVFNDTSIQCEDSL